MNRYINPNDPKYMAETDSQSIQNAIDAAESSSCHTVIIPRRCERTGQDEWMIDKTILLPSNITVILDDCHLTLVENVYENIFRNKNMYTEISRKPEGKQFGIRIIGRGEAILDGGKGNDLRERNSEKEGRPHIRFNNFILLNNVHDYVLENFKCIHMRWWAINQIACTNGRLSNLSFWNGNLIPNQDGINCRVGCSNILIENITGRTGDDVVALSAFPKWSDGVLVPEDGEFDIHDITIRNVRAHTRQTVVALRNTDGAKMYRITIDNIADDGGEYKPWGIVRIGENNYYAERCSVLGETYGINVQNIHSKNRGTVFLNTTLKDSHISNVYAEENALYAISTYYPESFNEETKRHVFGGITLENVVFDNIHYNAVPDEEDANYDLLNDGSPDFNGCALDFRCMGEHDTLNGVICRNIFASDKAKLLLCDERYQIKIEN
ncbi:MAG: hypothetical protein E7399_03855 [Ruminococcaceae bacterium]|nr:hypothetical protein [Oscillospiraceae bacterium]